MRLYKNGDRCPCCGTVLEGKSEDWLAEFSQLVADLGLPDWPPPELRGVAANGPPRDVIGGAMRASLPTREAAEAGRRRRQP